MKRTVKLRLKRLSRQRRAAISRLAIYRALSLLPLEYLVVNQTADEATTQKVKAEAEVRREARKKKHLRLARNQEVSDLIVAGGRRNLLRDQATRLSAREFLDAGALAQTTAYKDTAAT